jgi:enterochelin esterase-like enzyme
MKALIPVGVVILWAAASVRGDDAGGFRWVNPLPVKLPANVKHSTFHSEANRADVGYAIYLPPGYDDAANTQTRYPVVYWLHGGRPGSEAKAVNMAAFIDRRMRSGEVPPMIYVFPNGGRLSHYDHGDSKGEQAFLELIRHVDQTYRTIADRSGRAVEGFSQGGRGAARYMFQHTNLFCSAAPMGGGHQHEQRIDQNAGVESDTVKIDPAWNNTWELARRFAADKTHPPLRIIVVVGSTDMNFEANQQWHAHLDSLGIAHEFVVVEGVPHSATQVYERSGAQVMQFHAESFRRAKAQ